MHLHNFDLMMDTDINHLHTLFMGSTGVNTDSRTIKPGEIFFAIKGENFDGNEYAEKALEAGAAYAIVSAGSAAAESAGKDSRIIPVEDTLYTLKALARTHRCAMMPGGKRLPVIGLTGTNGKTTTKELIRAVLEKKYRVTATQGNLNNEIGVPLSLLKITGETQIAVIEMGASHPGDIKSLVEVSMPDYGLITNVGKGHLLGFGSYEGVRKTKGELYDYIRGTGGKIFLNEDLPYLQEMASERGIEDIIPYGVNYDGVKILPPDPEKPFIRMEIPVSCTETCTLETNLVGRYNAENIMAAISVGKYFGVPVAEIIEAISGYTPSNNRSQLVETGRNTLIVDAYNANPVSMEAAISNLGSIRSEKKAVMLGDMLELGHESAAEHEKVIRRIAGMGLKEAFLVGPEFGAALAHCGIPEHCRHFSTSDQLAGYLEERVLSGYTILIKGSRGTHMENVISAL